MNQTGADPGFEKGGAQVAQGPVFGHIQANFGDFLKNLAQKRVGPPLSSGSAPVKCSCFTYNNP